VRLPKIIELVFYRILFFFITFFLIFFEDNQEERGRLQKGKVVGLGVSSVTVGLIESDKRKIKILERSEVTVIDKPLLSRRYGGLCSGLSVVFLTVIFSLFLFMNVFSFSFTQVIFLVFLFNFFTF